MWIIVADGTVGSGVLSGTSARVAVMAERLSAAAAELLSQQYAGGGCR